MIFYFSGTGNSKYIGEKLASNLNDKAVSINNLIKNNSKDEIKVDSNLIIVAPSYFMRIPKVVMNWFKDTNFINAKNVYFIITYYSMYNNAKKYNKELCALKGLNYFGTMPINMPNNHITMYKTSSITEAKEIIDKANDKINDIAQLIKESKPFVDYKVNLMDMFMSSCMNLMLSKMMIKSKPFFVNDKCNGCSLCVNNCPLNNIKLIDKKPVWGNNCTHCLACINYCPNEAIEFGNKTKGKERYNIEKVLKQKAK